MQKRFGGFEATCRAYEAEHGVQVVRLDDGEGVLIDGGAVEICRIEGASVFS